MKATPAQKEAMMVAQLAIEAWLVSMNVPADAANELASEGLLRAHEAVGAETEVDIPEWDELWSI